MYIVKARLLPLSLFLLINFYSRILAQSVTAASFPYSGSTQTFVMPSCVSEISVTILGAGGGNGGWAGGHAAMVYAVLQSTPGALLYINVGQQATGITGGWNGGGNGGVGTNSVGSGGGGATDIRLNNNSLSSRIIVMGGGGGGGSSYYGSAYGGDAMGFGFNCSTVTGTGGGGGDGWSVGGVGACSGGTATGYGTGGAGGGLNSGGAVSGAGSGGFGQAGSFALGGNGGGSVASYGGTNGGVYGAGGGGGGVYGGAGGMCGAFSEFANSPYSGGGGAGSSYIDTNIFKKIVLGGTPYFNGSLFLSYTYTSPVVMASASPSICESASVVVSASGVPNFTWIPVGNFSGSNSNSINISPPSTTHYTVMGTNSVGCISSTIVPVTVYQNNPTITVNNSSSASGGICPNQTVALTASGAVTYSWTGAVSNGSAFALSSSQQYTVTGNNGCGTGTAVVSVSVHPLPVLVAVPSSSIVCFGSTLSLSGTGASVYTWTPSSVINNTPFTPNATATYTLKGASAQGCTNTAVTTVSVVTTPTLNPTASSSFVCPGGSAVLYAAPGSVYNWQPGNQTSSSITVSPNVTSTYTLVQGYSQCSTTKTITVHLAPFPTFTSGISQTTVCSLSPVVLSASGAVTYAWYSQSVYLGSGSSLTTTPFSSSNYSVTASNGSCSATQTLALTVLPNPTITLNVSSPSVCAGQTVSLNAGGATSYIWTLSTSTLVQTGSVVTVNPSGNLLYTVTASDGNNCQAVKNGSVAVYALPNLSVSVPQALICRGDSVTLSASGALTYTWNTAAAFSPTFSVKPTVTSVYNLTGADAKGCGSSTLMTISVFDPTITVTSLTTVCLGKQVNLSAGGATSYSWNGISSASTVSVAPIINTIYTVSATSYSNTLACINSATTEVIVLPLPVLTILATREKICLGESSNLTAAGALNYTWLPTIQSPSITLSPSITTVYTLTGTDSKGCESTLSYTLTVSECTSIEENGPLSRLLIYPNPSSGQITISGETDMNVTIVDNLGKQLFLLQFNNTNSVRTFTLAPGIYFALINQKGTISSQRIVVLN